MNSKRRRAESFEACCQWALLNVQIIALLFPLTVQQYIYPPVSKVHAGSLTWTTWSLTCVRHYSYACLYTRGLGTPTASQHKHFYSQNSHKFFLCSWRRRGSNLRCFGSLDLESDALPTEPCRNKKRQTRLSRCMGMKQSHHDARTAYAVKSGVVWTLSSQKRSSVNFEQSKAE